MLPPELWMKVQVIAPVITLFGWLAGRQNDEDEEAHRLVQDGLSDADMVRGVECATERNLRDQLSVEEAERINEEIEQQRRGWWN